ncbi:hypothetical protein FRB96_006775, partial [Tulasnella sp. 330]
ASEKLLYEQVEAVGSRRTEWGWAAAESAGVTERSFRKLATEANDAIDVSSEDSGRVYKIGALRASHLESSVSPEVPEASNESLPSSPPFALIILDQQWTRQAAQRAERGLVHLIPPSLDVPTSTAQATPTPVGDEEANLPPPLTSAPVSLMMDSSYTPTATRALPLLPELVLGDDEGVSAGSIERIIGSIVWAGQIIPLRIPHGWFDRMCGEGAHSAPDTSSSSTSSESAPPLMISRANVGRPVNTLSQICEAVLKLGKFMSIQDAHVLPDQIGSALRRVRNPAHHMLEGRMEQIMKTQRGPEWRSLFETFETMPIASAFIGQVHAVTLFPSLPFYPNHTHPNSQSPPPPTRLAVKAQFLNIQNSITSDIRTITAL